VRLNSFEKFLKMLWVNWVLKRLRKIEFYIDNDMCMVCQIKMSLFTLLVTYILHIECITKRAGIPRGCIRSCEKSINKKIWKSYAKCPSRFGWITANETDFRGKSERARKFVDILERTVDTLVRGPFYQYGRQFVLGDWIRNCVFVSLW
jgi:hypothetical protein